MNKVVLMPFEDPEQNANTPYYAVIRGIDKAAQLIAELDGNTLMGPLNKNADIMGVGVYLKPFDNMVNSQSLEHGLERNPEYRINDQMERLLFYGNTNVHVALPRIRTVVMPKGATPSKENPVIKIAICSFSRLKAIGDDALASARIVPRAGVTFGVEYGKQYAGQFEEGVLSALDRAIYEGCNILIFPELVISPPLVEALARRLADKGGDHSLCLVVAGSAWMDENNVCTLLDAYGHTVGTYYKRSPYCKLRELMPGKRRQADRVEGLRNPGRECTLAYIPGFGVVVPSICKDLVSDERHTIELAAAFRASLVCCVAMSPSLDKGFDAPSVLLAKQYFTMACVCNWCSVRRKDEISLVATPAFRELEGRSENDLVREFVKRNQECSEDCKVSGSCLHIVTVDYGRSTEDGLYPIIEVDGPYH